MKTTEHFKNTIKAYLEKRVEDDFLFRIAYSKANKNIDDCITYILNTVKQSGCNGFTDDEIYSMAVHYYDEDNINVGGTVSCNVIVNHTVELTEEEKQQARIEAKKRLENEVYAKMKYPVKPVKQNIITNQQSLF